MRKRRRAVIIFIVGCICGLFIEDALRRYIEFESEASRSSKSVSSRIKKDAIYNDLSMLYDRNSNAALLSKKIKVLCWILTEKASLHSKAKSIKETWGRHCNILLFISSDSDKNFPAIALNVDEGYNNLWLKTKAAWEHVFHKHYHEAHWFVKADDDTFMIMENLRFFLSKYKHTDDHFFGRNLWTKELDYNSGGAGYVLSKGALRKFAAVLSNCKPQSKAEDIALATCLKRLDIKVEDTRDENNKETFHPFAPDFHLIPGAIEKTNWLFKLNKWEVNDGPNCCSEYSIAFHYTTPRRMQLFYYYLYILKKGNS